MTAPLEVDLAIVGSGFAGSLLAMVARRIGLRVALLERGSHPRFAIGESASPLAGVILEQLAQRYDLPRIAPLATYGEWRRRYPQVGCGLKRGFTYFKHEPQARFARRADRRNELLVAASPDDERSDTHWLRADVDHFLVQEAIALDTTFVDQLQLDAIEWRSDHAVLSGVRRGSDVRVAAAYIVDASGPGGFLSRVLELAVPAFQGYPGTQALYSHFTGVARCADMPEYASADQPPYAMDAAALHHVFDEGWMWVLRFDNGVTSAGVAVTDALAAEIRLADGEPAWHRLLARYPSIAAQFADARPVRAFTWMPRLAWRTSSVAGDRWAMLPSAAAFVDPLFSTGIPLTLLGVERLARGLSSSGPLSDSANRLRGAANRVSMYQETTFAEADHVAGFIAGCYAAFPRFDDFTAWSMFYFAAASFSEISRRLHGDTWSRGFLCAQDAGMVRALSALSPARCRASDLADRVAALVEPINVAGLAHPAKRNWYSVDAEETVAAAAKLNAAPEAIRELFGAIEQRS